MNPNGVMAEIRGLLQQGKSSTEVIALGYAPSSVYKAQRQIRKTTERPDPPVTQVVVTNLAPEGWAELKEENAHLRQQLSPVEELEAKQEALQNELDVAPEPTSKTWKQRPVKPSSYGIDWRRLNRKPGPPGNCGRKSWI